MDLAHVCNQLEELFYEDEGIFVADLIKLYEEKFGAFLFYEKKDLKDIIQDLGFPFVVHPVGLTIFPKGTSKGSVKI